MKATTFSASPVVLHGARVYPGGSMRCGVKRVDPAGLNEPEAELLVVDTDDPAVVAIETDSGERYEVDREAWEQLHTALEAAA